jgi:hypothetical protein
MAASDTARRLIAKFGRSDGELSRPRQALEAVPGRPWAAQAQDPAVDPVLAAGLSVVVLDAKTVLRPELILPEQTAVAYLAAGLEPRNLDVLTTRGKSYSVLEVEELAPGDDTALFTLHLKGR